MVAGGPQALTARVRGGILWGAVNVFLSKALQFVTTAVVARLVAPESFGALAIALAVQTIVISANELGVTAALARGAGDADDIAPTVYTIALVTSAALTGGMFLGADRLAALMGDERAGPVVQVMSLTVLLGGLGSVPAAMIWREFYQGRRLAADLANVVSTTAVVVPLALAGWGAMALAWSRVAGQVAALVVLLALTPRRYKPGLDRRALPGLLRLGAPLASANIVVFATLNVDYLVVGRQLGATQLGLYLLAFNLSSLPSNVIVQIVRTVAVPAFGRLHEAGGLQSVAPQALGFVALATFPVGALLAGLAEPLMSTVYGARWAPAGAALVGLGVFAAGRTMTEVLSDLLLGAGRTGSLLWVQILWLSALVPVMIGCVMSWGLAGAGAAHSVVVWLVVLPAYLVMARNGAGLPLGAMLRPLLLPGLAAVAAGAVAWQAATLASDPLVACLLGAVSGAAVYLLATGRLLTDLVRILRSA